MVTVRISIISDEGESRLYLVNHVLTSDQHLCMHGSVKEIALPVTGEQLVDAIKEVSTRGTIAVSKSYVELSKMKSPIEEHLGVKSWKGVFDCRKLIVISMTEDTIQITPSMKFHPQGYDYLPSINARITDPEDVLTKFMCAIEKSTTNAVTSSKNATISLPRRISWLAIRGEDIELLVKELLKDGYQEMTCREGLDIVSNDLFDCKAVIMPPVKGWMIIAAFQAFTDYFSYVNAMLMHLSSRYHRAQAFAQDTVVEYYQWIQAVDGRIKRAYVYHGEAGGVVSQYGRMTHKEADLKSRSISGNLEPDEESVGIISGSWSINPLYPQWGETDHVYVGYVNLDRRY